MASLTPENIPALHHILLQSVNADPKAQKAAEAELQGLASRAGYCSCLLEILRSASTDPTARWMAVLQLKNTVGKQWRRELPGALSPEEKEHLRARLISAIGEMQDRQLAVQLGVTIAKIARVDFPATWPSLLTDLMGLIGTDSSGLQGRRALLVLHYVLKELASKRLASDQRIFEQASGILLPPLAAQWSTATTTFLSSLQQQQPAIDTLFEAWYLELKCLRRLLAQCAPSDAKSLACPAPVVESLPTLLSALCALSRLAVLPPAHKGSIKLLKTLVQLQEQHPWSFWASGALLPLMEWCIDWLMQLEVSAAGGSSALVRYPLLFLFQALRCPSYRGASTTLTLNLAARKQVTQQASMAAEVRPGIESFWSKDGRRQSMLRRLVSSYFPLTQAELEEWVADPEAFHHAALNVAWEESVHGCGEHLAMALFEGHREELAPIVLELLQSVTGVSESAQCGSVQQLLAKEAVYKLVAVAADELHEALNFSSWLQSSGGGLLADMRAPPLETNPQVVRRQALLLPSYWLGTLRKEDRVALYEMLLTALGPSSSNDLAIRLAALVTMQALVEDWGFEEAAFVAFAPGCFDALASLLRDTSELDSQVQAFNLLNTIIDRLAEGAAPFAPGLLALLPAVWAGPVAGSPLLGMQMLGTLARLTYALGEDRSPMAYSVLIPALQAVLTPAGDVGLLEDGLQTWLVALRCAPSSDRRILESVWPVAWTAVMDSSTEHVAVGSQIAASALLLGENGVPGLQQPSQSFFFSDRSNPFGHQLATTLALWLQSVNDRGVSLVASTLALGVQLSPPEADTTLEPALRMLIDRTLVPENESGSLGAPAVAAALCALSRLVLRSEPGPLALLRLLGSPERAAQLMDVWIARFDSIGRAGLRKLSALGLATMLQAPLGTEVFTAKLEPIIAHLTAVWFEVEELANPGGNPSSTGHDHLFLDFLAPSSTHDDGAVVSSEDAAGEAARREALWQDDPVRTTQLAPFLRQQLQAASAVHGEAVVQSALSAVDPTLQEQLQRMLGMES